MAAAIFPLHNFKLDVEQQTVDTMFCAKGLERKQDSVNRK